MPTLDEIYDKVSSQGSKVFKSKWAEGLSGDELSQAFKIDSVLDTIKLLADLGRITITDQQKRQVALSYARNPYKYITQDVNAGIVPYLEDAGVKVRTDRSLRM